MQLIDPSEMRRIGRGGKVSALLEEKVVLQMLFMESFSTMSMDDC